MVNYKFDAVARSGEVVHSEVHEVMPFCHGKRAKKMANDYNSQVTVTNMRTSTVVGVYDPEEENK